MIIDKEIKFGYGDIIVGCQTDLQDKFVLTLTEIEPPQEIGKRIPIKGVKIIKELEIEVIYDEIAKLRDCLLRIKHNGPDIVDFKGCSLDFTEYNPKSIDVVVNVIDSAIACFLRPLAC